MESDFSTNGKGSVIRLGFEVGTGREVRLPLGHMVIVGMTQRAGKTTTLEACAARSAMKCIAFLTKRGEASFRLSREIQPYYEDHIDWRTVRALCEALTEEKWDKFQRQCLRSVCRAGQAGRFGTKSFVEWPRPESLEDICKNVAVALTKATGQREMVLGEIQEDLRTAIEELLKLKTQCADPDLKSGLNVIDLERYEFHIQSLVIRSMIRWVLKHGEKTIIAVPEAWKFVPAQRRSPVRDAAEEFIRQGAALENFLWIDSQNISGISGVLLSQIRVWLFGVQRLRSEIEKTLDAIPDNIYPRPRAADIATLGRGEFFACFDQEMYRTYVWPAWMSSALHAEAIARGEESLDSAREIVREFDEEHEHPE
jgi:hypothetical protein